MKQLKNTYWRTKCIVIYCTYLSSTTFVWLSLFQVTTPFRKRTKCFKLSNL